MSETQAPNYAAISRAAEEASRILEMNGDGNAVNVLTEMTNEDNDAWMAKRIAEFDAQLQAQAKQIELMLRQLDVESEIVASLMKRMADRTAQTSSETEEYIRLQITKNTKGYSYETSVSLRAPQVTGAALSKLLATADREARIEIARRESLDEGITR